VVTQRGAAKRPLPGQDLCVPWPLREKNAPVREARNVSQRGPGVNPKFHLQSRAVQWSDHAGAGHETRTIRDPLAMEVDMPSVTTPSGLVYEDLAVGSGNAARSGSDVLVHYTGWLANGTKFDSSLDRGEPFGFPLGQGQVISGWDEGVEGMRVGGKRKLTIPPTLGYGAYGTGGVIPPNATLVFEVELLQID